MTVPQTITTADDASAALAVLTQAARADPVNRAVCAAAGIPRGALAMPWQRTPRPLTLHGIDGDLPPLLGLTTQGSYTLGDGLAAWRHAGESELTTGSIYPITEWRLIAQRPLTAGRGLLVLRDPLRSRADPSPPTLARFAVAVLTARSHADRLSTEADRDGARAPGALRAEASALTDFADQVEALIPPLALPWYPDVLASLAAAPVVAPTRPAYRRVPINTRK